MPVDVPSKRRPRRVAERTSPLAALTLPSSRLAIPPQEKLAPTTKTSTTQRRNAYAAPIVCSTAPPELGALVLGRRGSARTPCPARRRAVAHPSSRTRSPRRGAGAAPERARGEARRRSRRRVRAGGALPWTPLRGGVAGLGVPACSTVSRALVVAEGPRGAKRGEEAVGGAAAAEELLSSGCVRAIAPVWTNAALAGLGTRGGYAREIRATCASRRRRACGGTRRRR